MPPIEGSFKLHTARSAGFEIYQPGDVAYVSNSLRDNGVIGYVTARSHDRVFRFLGICVSAFGEATVQVPPFIARGNGGSGLIVLEPLRPMTFHQLGYVAGYINEFIRWRFSWYRQASVQRIRSLEIPDPARATARFAVDEFVPKPSGPAKHF